MIFGLAPALHVSKTDINEVLKEGGRSGGAGIRARRWTSSLIVAELALTLVLLAGAGFMMRNFLTMYSMDLGMDTSKLLVMRLALPERKYPALEQRLAFYQQIEDRLKANPRIEAVTIASNMPLQGGFMRRLTLDGKPLEQGQQAPEVTMLTIDPRYFDTVGLPLIRGRGLTDEDGMTGRESAIINQQFAKLHFPNEDPIGRRIVLNMDLQGGAAPGNGIPTSLTATVVGIAPNVRQRNFQQAETDPVAYLPFRTDPRAFMTLLVRSQGDPNAMSPILREEVRAIDADLPLFGIRTMDQELAQARWPFRIFGTMFAIFAFIALALSAVGLYAVTAYSVTQRTQEIGVRMALGAQGNQVAWLFMKRSFILLAIGLTLGVAGAFGVGQLFSSTQLLIQTSARDPITIGGIALLLAVGRDRGQRVAGAPRDAARSADRAPPRLTWRRVLRPASTPERSSAAFELEDRGAQLVDVYRLDDLVLCGTSGESEEGRRRPPGRHVGLLQGDSHLLHVIRINHRSTQRRVAVRERRQVEPGPQGIDARAQLGEVDRLDHGDAGDERTVGKARQHAPSRGDRHEMVRTQTGRAEVPDSDEIGAVRRNGEVGAFGRRVGHAPGNG